MAKLLRCFATLVLAGIIIIIRRGEALLLSGVCAEISSSLHYEADNITIPSSYDDWFPEIVVPLDDQSLEWVDSFNRSRVANYLTKQVLEIYEANYSTISMIEFSFGGATCNYTLILCCDDNVSSSGNLTKENIFATTSAILEANKQAAASDGSTSQDDFQWQLVQLGNLTSYRIVDASSQCAAKRAVPEMAIGNGDVDFNIWNAKQMPPNVPATATTIKPATNSFRLVSPEKIHTGSLWHKNVFSLTDFYVDASLTIGGPTRSHTFVSLFFAANSSIKSGDGFFLSGSRDASAFTVTVDPGLNSIDATINNVFYEGDLTALDVKDNKVNYQIRVSNSNFTLDVCVANKCVRPIKAITLPERIASKFEQQSLFFGITAYIFSNIGIGNSVDVNDVAVYDCSNETNPAISTTTTRSNSTTQQAIITTDGVSKSDTFIEAFSAAAQTTRQPDKAFQPTGVKGSPDLVENIAKVRSIVGSSSEALQGSFKAWQDDATWAVMTAAQLLLECTDFAPNRTAPPPSRRGNVTFVRPSFAVNRLAEIDTVKETASVSGLLLLTWQITTCPLNSVDAISERPAQELYVTKSNEVWTPAFRFVNSASQVTYMQDNDDFGDDLLASMRHDPKSPNRILDFYWLKEGTFTATCPLDMTKFPFDKQTCVFSFSLTRSSSIVAFSTPEFFWSDDDQRDESSSEWRYEGAAQYLTSLRYKGLPTSAAHFCITLKRNPGYYVTNLILPSLVLVIVNVGSFILPSDLPDRPTLSMTVLLAITVAQSTVMGQIPKTPHSVLLTDYIASMSWLCAACTMYQMFTCWMANIGGEESKNRQQQKSSKSCLAKVGLVRICDMICAILATTALVIIQIYYLV